MQVTTTVSEIYPCKKSGKMAVISECYLALLWVENKGVNVMKSTKKSNMGTTVSSAQESSRRMTKSRAGFGI